MHPSESVPREQALAPAPADLGAHREGHIGVKRQAVLVRVSLLRQTTAAPGYQPGFGGGHLAQVQILVLAITLGWPHTLCVRPTTGYLAGLF